MLKAMVLVAGLTLSIVLPIGSNAAQPGSVFGLELQEPLTIPQCPYETDHDKAIYLWPAAGACYELPSGDAPGEIDASRIVDEVPADGPVVIVWQVADKPAIVSGRGAMAQMAAGKLQRVVFETKGVGSQEEVYDTLMHQFGAATSTQRVPLEGAPTSASPMLAKWTLDQVDVLFYSAVEGPDRGVVSISAHPSNSRMSTASSKAFWVRDHS